MQNHILKTLTVSMILSGCFQLPVSSDGKVSSAEGVAQLVEAKTVSETKYVSSIDPNSTTDQKLAAPTVEGLQGASVVIPPGSLGIAAELVVEQAADFSETSITTEMGLADDIQVSSTSPGMIIRPTENVDLKKPLTLSMPLPTSLGIRLQSTGSRYAIFYKYFDPTEQRLVTGLKVVDGVNVKLAFDEASAKDLISFEGYFGAYWAAVLSREVKTEEVPPPKPAEEPIINSAKVSVIETKGIVSEAEIVVKQQVQIPENSWQKPVLNLLTTSRAVTIKAVATRTVSGCKVDLFESPKMSSGISLEAPLGPEVEVPIAKKTAHNLYGRFRCVDDQGRFTASPWSEALSIPALEEAPVATVPSDPLGLCADKDYPQVKIRGMDHGQIADAYVAQRINKCVYKADIYLGGGEEFIFSINDGSTVCDLPSHALKEGAQTLTCHPATAGAVGGNLMSAPHGNYTGILDFSKSLTEPVLTLSKIPCDRGDFHVLIGTGSSFEAISASNKMSHIGGCEYIYNKAGPSTLDSTQKVTIVSSQGNYYCGNRENGSSSYSYGYDTLSTDRNFDNVCSSTPSHFAFAESITALSHRFVLRLGQAAKEYDKDPSAESSVRYSIESSCPHELYLYGPTSAGQEAIYRVNGTYRRGACRYEFAFAASSSNGSDHKFRVGNHDKSILCGTSTSSGGSYWTADCSGSASEIEPSSLEAGKVYKVTVQGSGSTSTMSLDSVSITPLDAACDSSGLYLASSVVNGLEHSASKAFAEVDKCVFEKIWTPTANSMGFYVTNGQGNMLCGSDYDPSNVPVLNGAEIRTHCHHETGSAAYLGALSPLNISAGTSYKLKVDLRYKSFDGSARIQLSSFTEPNCADDLHMLSSTISSLGTSKNSTNKFTYLGNCTYMYTLAGHEGSGASIYLESQAGQRCGGSASLSLSGGGSSMLRSTNLDCSSTAEVYLTSLSADTTARFYVKKASGQVQLTAQNLRYSCTESSYSYSNAKPLRIAGQAANSISESSRAFGSASGNQCVYEYLWNPSSSASFTLQGADSDGYCGLAASASTITGFGERDAVCRISADGQIRPFGSFSAQPYLISFKTPRHVEERAKIKLSAVSVISNTPIAAWLSGSDLNRSAGIESGTGAHPSARQSAMTWTDDQGDLWLFGGYGVDVNEANNTSIQGLYSDLWKYDTSNSTWSRVKGDAQLNQQNSYSDGSNSKPSARISGATWFDQAQQRLWLFGGLGMSSDGSISAPGKLSDLWYFDLNSLLWVYVNGSHLQDDAGQYGSMNNFSESGNQPSARYGMQVWKAGNELWLFGGVVSDYGSSDPTDEGPLNDLWSYDLGTNKWTWRGGNNSVSSSTNMFGTSSQIAGRAAAASWFDSTNSKVYVYGGLRYSPTSSSSGPTLSGELWRLDLSTQVWSRLKGNDADYDAPYSARSMMFGVFSDYTTPGRWASGAFWKNGNDEFWLFGGSHASADPGSNHLQDFWVYKPSLNQWVRPGNSATGFDAIDQAPVHASGSFSSSNALGGRSLMAVWESTNGPYIFGGIGVDSTSSGTSSFKNDLWQIDLP